MGDKQKKARQQHMNRVLEQLLPPELEIGEGKPSRALVELVKGWNYCRESMKGRAAALLDELH